MFLPFRQGMRFFRLFDLVSTYAHRRLHVASDAEFFNGDPPRGIGEQAQLDTCEELWKHLEILDDYVILNPDRLSNEDLKTVASWRNCYSDMFSVHRLPQGSRNDLVFVSQGYAFVVCGLSREITALLRDIPAFVQTTLLPYDGRIVYAMFMQQLPIALGEGVRETLKRELESAVTEGRVIRTGEEFIEAAHQARKSREEHEVEKFRRDLEMEERAAGPLPGQHRGVLAGMSKEERAQAIDDHLTETTKGRPSVFDPQEALSEWCEPGEVVTSIEELAALSDDPDEAEDIMRSLADEEVLFDDLCHKREQEITSLRAMAEAGGRMPVDLQDLHYLKDVVYPTLGLCHYFREGDGYVAVMADEVLEVARKVDWDAALDYCRQLKELYAFFNVIVELRGIVEREAALEEYYAVCPNGIRPKRRALDELFDGAISDEATMYMLDVDGRVYLVHYELMWERFSEQGIDWREGDVYEEGDLGQLLEGLLRQQRGKEPRPVLREMVDAESLYDWKEEQPPTIAMRDFLDEHVPDECDDYYFADRVIEELIGELRWGMVKEGIQAFFDILSNNDFEPDESQLNQLINLWMNMCNGLPNWPNNGWTPNELAQRTSRKPMFFNPDGSVKKVGRNDPCPCGSGKKYKRCCGR